MRKTIAFCLFFLISITGFSTDFYWVNGSGNWSDFSIHWATTSNGSTMHSNVPTLNDNVFFDSLSFTSLSEIVTVDTAAICKTMDWSTATKHPKFSGLTTDSLSVYGSFLLNPSMDYNYLGELFYCSQYDDTINTQGNFILGNSSFLGSDSLILKNNYFSKKSISFQGGRVLAENYNITCSNFDAEFTRNRHLYFSSGNLILTGDGFAFKGSNNGFTFVQGSGNIQLNYTGTNKVIFKGAFSIYNNLIVNANLVEFEEAGTFNNLTISAGTHLILPEFNTQNFTSLTANGTCGLPIIIEATQDNFIGVQATLNTTGGAVTSTYLRLKNIATTGSVFTANNSIDEGNNTGWTINGITDNQDMYWIGATGNWNDPAHWSYSSGGGTSNCVPGPNNNVFFNVGSGFVKDTVFVLNNAYCDSMDWTGAANSPVLIGDTIYKIELQGSIKLTANLTADYTGIYLFNSTTVNTINLQGVTLNGEVQFLSTGQWTLQNDFNSNQNIRFNEGTFNTNSFNLSIAGFISNSGLTRNLDLTTSTIKAFGKSSALPTGTFLFGADSVWFINSANLTLNTGTSTIEMNSTSNLSSLFYGGTNNYNKLTVNCPIADIYNPNIFSLLEVKKGKSLRLESGITQTLDSLIANGSCDSPITLQSTLNFQAAAQLQKTGYDTLTVSNCLIKNIDALVTGTEYYLAQSSNLQNSTNNWDTNLTSTPNTYYWIGGTGNWSNVNNWSLISGGPLPVSCLPTIRDTVIFDNNSFSVNGETVTLDIDGQCAKMDWSAITFSPIFDFKKDLNVAYQAIFHPNLEVTRNNISSTIFFLTKSNSFFDPQGAIMDINFIYGATNGTDTLLLQSKFNTGNTGVIILEEGTFISQADSVFASSFRISSDSTKTIHLGSTYYKILNSVIVTSSTASTTLNSETSFIEVVGSNSPDFFYGNGFTYNDVKIGSLGDTTQLGGANTFNKLIFNPGLNIEIEQATTQTVIDSFLIVGTCNDYITIHSALAGTQATITQFSLKTKAECLNLRDIKVSGAINYFSTDQSNNTGWTFNLTKATNAGFTHINNICLGSQVTFNNTSTAISGNPSDLTYVWALGNRDTVYGTSPSYKYLSSGVFYVTLISEYLNGCKDTLIDSVNVNEPEVRLFTSEYDTTICFGDSVTFNTFNSLDNYQFFINNDSVTSLDTTNIFITTALNNNDTIEVRGELNGCPITSNNYIYTVNNNPPLTSSLSSNSDTICSVDNVTFTGGGADLYQFFKNGTQFTLASSIDSFVLVGLSTNDSVHVVGSYNITGCKTQSTKHIFTVNPMPNIALTNTTGTPICQGELLNLSATGANTYQFYINGITQGAFSATNTFSSTTINNGDTIKVVGDSLNCRTLGTPEFIIPVNAIPSVMVTPSNTNLTICAGDNILFTASGAAIYEFYINGNSQASASGSNTFNTNTLSHGDTIVVRGETFGCVGYGATDTIIVTPLPIVTLTNNDPDTTICLNDFVTFTASGATQYQFLVNGIPATTMSVTNTYTTDSIQNGKTITVLGLQSGCSNVSVDSYTFIVNPISNINFATSDTLICEGDNITFTAVGGTTYEFFVNGVSQGTPSLSNVFSTTGLPSGTPLVTVTGFLNGCGSLGNQSYNVQVKPIPIVGFTLSNNTICNGDSIVFTASNATTYQFTFDGIAQGPFSPTNTFVSSTINNGQQIGVLGTLNGCFNASDSVYTITVNSVPSTTLASSDLDNIICEGSAITFTGNGVTNYEFFIDSISLGTTASATYTTDSLQTGQTISVIGHAANGCQLKAPSTFTITANPLPNISLASNDPDTTICEGDNIVFTANGSNFYEFFLNGISQGVISTIATYNNNMLVNSDVISVVGQTNFGCSNNGVDTFTVIVKPTPTVTLLSSDLDNQICTGESVTFNASGATNYEFFINSTSQGAPSLINSNVIGNLSNGDVVSVIGESNGCPATGDSTFIFNVFTFPIVTLTSFDSINNVCVGDTLNFTANGALTYEFFVDATSQGGVPTTNNLFSSFGLTNGQVVSVIGYNNICPANADTAYTITIAYPVVSLISNPAAATICFQDNLLFTASGANDYAFFLNQVQQTSISPTNTYQNNELETGDTIKVIGYIGSCASVVQTITLTVNKINLTLNSLLPNMLCTGASNTFTANGANLYQFLLNGTPIGVYSATNTYSGSFNDGDLVSVNGQNTTTGCIQSSDNIIISVYQNPVVSPPGPIQVCDGDSAQLFSDLSFGTQWYESGNSILSSNDSNYWAISTGNYSNSSTQGGSGTIWSTGNNANGQLGDSTTIGSQVPIIANAVRGKSIAAGIFHNVVAKNDGTVWVWGDNSFGQMGDGTFSDRWSPQQVATITTANDVTAGDNFCMVLLNTGTLVAFGDNTVGQLGLGNNGISNFPVAVPGLSNITAVSGGGEFSIALDNVGNVWSWGLNNFGQLGNGTNANTNAPNQLTALSNVIAISTGRNHVLVLKNDGTVWAWGDNSQGQLGISGINFSTVPVQIGLFNNIIAVSAGADHSLILDNKSNAYSFGNNSFGQLGLSNNLSFDTPQKITNEKFVAINALYFNSFALKSDSSVWSWGKNQYGQLGNTQTSNSNTPIYIKNFNGARIISGGEEHTVVLMSRENSCQSNVVIITIDSIPPVVINIINDTTLTTPSIGVSYQWYLNGNLIPGATSNTWSPTIDADYSVEVFSSNGCSLVSQEFSWYSVGLRELLDTSVLNIYPNPSKGIFNVETTSKSNTIISLSVYNLLGEKLLFSITNLNEINLTKLSNGLYYLKIEIEKNTYIIKKLLKE